MLGKGGSLHHLTYIDNLVEGIILCGTVGRAVGNTYILAGERYIPICESRRRDSVCPSRLHMRRRQCARGSVSRWESPPPLYKRRLDFFREDRAFDITKAKRELGYRPRIDLAEGVHRAADWYRQHNYLSPATDIGAEYQTR